LKKRQKKNKNLKKRSKKTKRDNETLAPQHGTLASSLLAGQSFECG
jgi:hypothetical protein